MENFIFCAVYEDSQIIFKLFLTDGPKKIHAEIKKSKSGKQNTSKGKKRFPDFHGYYLDI